MARKKSTEETDYWLIPKRSSIHQVWCLIDGIKERGVNGKAWTPTLQNDLGVNLKKWGATNDGRNISPQAMRTLNAFAQYLGFIYIDNTCSPSVIRVTKAGERFWENCRPHIRKLRNLIVDKDIALQTSDDVRLQMEKLQITNPILEKKCTKVSLFPFRTTLRLLLDLEYLDVEELGMFVFNMKDESEYGYVKSQIESFRQMPTGNRRALVESFKDTTIGNISLVKAPSSGYYGAICERTGLICRQYEKVCNSGCKVRTIRLQEGVREYVEEIINKKYAKILPYDFEDNLRLWIEYYGDPDRIETPINALVRNQSKDDVLVSVLDSTHYVLVTKVVKPGESLTFPAFNGDEYTLKLFSTIQRKALQNIEFTPTNDQPILCLDEAITKASRIETFDTVKSKIIEHIEAKHFAGEMAQLLRSIKIQAGVDKESDSMLRGAYLESLFYELLKILEREGKVQDVRWNGRYNSLGLPVPAPGGKCGTPDITFEVDNKFVFVLELTTMKSKSMQEQAEATSVPDHIRLTSEQSKLPVKGIFAAPIIHERVTNMMKATATHNGDQIGCITIENLLNVLAKEPLLHSLLAI